MKNIYVIVTYLIDPSRAPSGGWVGLSAHEPGGQLSLLHLHDLFFIACASIIPVVRIC